MTSLIAWILSLLISALPGPLIGPDPIVMRFNDAGAEESHNLARLGGDTGNPRRESEGYGSGQ